MISENLFNFYQKKVINVEFEKIGNLNENVSLIDDSFVGNEKETLVIDYCDDAVINEMIVDTILCYKHFEQQIKEVGMEENLFKENLFKIISIFSKYRPDLTYSRELSYISSFLLLVSENYYSAFVSMANLVISGYLGKFLIKETNFVRNVYNFS